MGTEGEEGSDAVKSEDVQPIEKLNRLSYTGCSLTTIDLPYFSYWMLEGEAIGVVTPHDLAIAEMDCRNCSPAWLPREIYTYQDPMEDGP